MVNFLSKYLIVNFILACINLSVKAQVQDSIIVTTGTDSTVVAATSDTIQEVVYKGVDLKTPRTAMMRSVMLPGLGQFYNKSYWKIPVVYAALGGVTYLAMFNQGQYHRFKKAYRQDVDKEIHEFSGKLERASIKYYRDKYQKDMELSYIGLVGIYALNILDAFVDAHLKSFDISEDISLGIKPSFQTIKLGYSTSPSAGVSLFLSLH